MVNKQEVMKLALYLDDNARGPEDNEAAKALRQFVSLFEIAYEMVWANSHEHSKDAYIEMHKLIKGDQNARPK